MLVLVVGLVAGQLMLSFTSIAYGARQ